MPSESNDLKNLWVNDETEEKWKAPIFLISKCKLLSNFLKKIFFLFLRFIYSWETEREAEA